jgi:hypothetical protein
MNSTDSDSSCNNSRINCAMAGVQVAFPAVSALSVINDLNCRGLLPITASYTTPLPLTSTYQIANFSAITALPTRLQP